jgi:hypothetical protein
MHRQAGAGIENRSCQSVAALAVSGPTSRSRRTRSKIPPCHNEVAVIMADAFAGSPGVGSGPLLDVDDILR